MWVCAHASLTFRRQLSKFFSQSTVFVKQFFRLVTSQPLFQKTPVLRLIGELGQRHLMRTPRSFNWFAVDELWPGPTLRGTQNDHGPRRTLRHAILSGVRLNHLDVVENGVESRGHQLMHRFGLVTF